MFDFGQLAATVGLSSLIATLITGFITSRLNKNERKFHLEKEEYYKLQEKAEIIFGYMYKNDQLLRTMFGQLNRNAISINGLIKDESDHDKFKQKIYEVIHVYFWDKSDQYNEYSEAMRSLMAVYFDVASKQNMTPVDIDKIGTLEPELRNKQFEFKAAILDSIKLMREKLRK